LKDPGGNTTTYGYNDDSSDHYALATAVKNALNQTTSANYDYEIEKPVDSYDLNGGHTHYEYQDGLDRLTKVTRPDGAVTSYSYTPTAVDTYRDQKAVNDQALHTEILYDGLGRESETRQYKSGSEYISTTRTCDALGQLATTTNPSIPGDGLNFATSYQSDGLGRNTLVQTADGAQVISSYAGNAVTVKDPAGHVRKTTSDALGRISSVTEDLVGLNYVTSYGYDPLNDLTSVTQSGQTRSFVYDSLGRLKTATNPESGTISYTYDANGNLVTKTDARNVIACFGSLSGTACTPGYDPLNRILNKTHSDGTPAVTYIYDDPTVPNAKGGLTSVSNGTSTTNYTNFDAVGNVLASNQIIAGETYTFGYTYNLADPATIRSTRSSPAKNAIRNRGWITSAPDITAARWGGLLARIGAKSRRLFPTLISPIPKHLTFTLMFETGH